jgi:hypothetical protein
LLRSISTVYKALCSITQTSVIIKAYEKAKMKPKNFSRMEREIRLMGYLGGGDGLVDLYAAFEDDNFKYLVSAHRLALKSIYSRPCALQHFVVPGCCPKQGTAAWAWWSSAAERNNGGECR